jgi:uncharacterized membrane protein
VRAGEFKSVLFSALVLASLVALLMFLSGDATKGHASPGVCENKEIVIVAQSQFCHERDNFIVTVHVAPPECGVELRVYENMEGVPGALVGTSIKVHNTGTVTDNFTLSVIPNGWGENVWIYPEVLENIGPSEYGSAWLHVRIPDNAAVCENKFVIVVAESQYCHETDNVTVKVHVAPPECGVDVDVWWWENEK